MDTVMVFIIVVTCVSFLLLYARKKKWASDNNRWLITGGLFLIGLSGYFFKGITATGYGFHILFIPIIYNCIDRLFKKISHSKSGRDFYLYLRGSNEIDDRLFAKNPHVNIFDKLFSISLVFIVIGLMLSSILIYRSFKY